MVRPLFPVALDSLLDPAALAAGATGGEGDGDASDAPSGIGDSPSQHGSSVTGQDGPAPRGGGRRVGLLFVSSSSHGLCAGSVTPRKGSFFCTKPFGVCQVLSHTTTRASLRAGHFYIRSAQGGKAFLDYSLSAETLLPGEVKSLMEDSRSVSAWIHHFKYRNAAICAEQEATALGGAPDDEEVVFDAPLDAPVDADGDILPSQTPYKRRRQGPGPGAGGTHGPPKWAPVVATRSSTFRMAPTVEAALHEQQLNEEPLSDALAQFCREVDEKNEQVADLCDRLAAAVNAAGAIAQEADRKVVAVGERLGAKPSWVADPDVVSAWSGIGSVKDDLDTFQNRVQQTLERLQDSPSRNTVSQLGIRVDQLHKQLEILRDSMPSFTLSRRMTEVTEVATELRRRVDHVELTLRDGYGPAVTKLSARSQRLEADQVAQKRLLDDRLSKLEAHVGNASPTATVAPPKKADLGFPLGADGLNDVFAANLGIGSLVKPEPSSGTAQPTTTATPAVPAFSADQEARLVALERRMGEQSEANPVAMQALAAQVRELSQTVTDLSNRLDGDAVRIGSHLFTSVDDCREFIVEHVDGNRFDLFYDMVSLLQRLGEDTMSLSASLQEDTGLLRSGYRTKSSGVIVSSFKSPFPKVLGSSGSDGSGLQRDHPVPALPSFQKFGPTVRQGLRERIETGLVNVVGGLQGVITTEIGTDAAATVAHIMVRQSHEHWRHVSAFIAETYNYLMAGSASKEETRKSNWQAVTRVVRNLFFTLHKARSIANELGLRTMAETTEAGAQASTSARILWAALQAHKIMEEVMKVSLRNHPIATAEFTNYLLEHQVHESSVSELQTKVSGLAGKVNSIAQSSRKSGNQNSGGNTNS